MTQVNRALIRQAILAAQANSRQVGGHTKTRGEVRGGGKKPYRQKGTGAARAGTRRSPIWTGGGITFGSRKEQNFSQVLPEKMKKAALLEMLKLKFFEKQIVVVDSLALKEPKTRLAVKILEDHNLKYKKVLFVTQNIEPELVMAAKNIPDVFVVTDDQLNILSVAKAEFVVMEEEIARKRKLIQEKSKSTSERTRSGKTGVKS